MISKSPKSHKQSNDIKNLNQIVKLSIIFKNESVDENQRYLLKTSSIDNRACDLFSCTTTLITVEIITSK